MEMQSPCPNTITVRRNPPRKARPTPSTTTAPPPSSQPNVTNISSFPIDDILSIQIPQPQPPPPPNQSVENLRVFLRIRPLKPRKIAGDLKPRTKNAWPQTKKNEMAKEKKSESCVVVNDTSSITLLQPLAMQQDSKKVKSEVYEGFSHVFSPDSSQGEVYQKMVNPLVEDFLLRGKSGMIAALGPSGSGKTHTMFGCPREPGIVPLILQKIFYKTEESPSKTPRKFYISMFEIYSERGKGEKMSDLFPDGGDIFIQQSSLKGLQELIISGVTEAESLIARGMLRRATAMTNTNSQSSRSQCIINIRCAPEICDEETESAVLTIVDLAGAEREKRTGNQGARLLESNFINNTSMVFSLCLRSLLEHQKNPKKQLQKHFLNSLLTRYLRDYLEGKKRMTLILTVKPGEEDYLDTSFVLRQAAPYMKIKFNLVGKPSTSGINKRQFQTFPRSEQSKKVKINDVDACEIEERKSSGKDHQLVVEEVITENVKKGKPVTVLLQSPEVSKTITTSILPSRTDYNSEHMGRSSQIMQNFAKALWNVLKEYKSKLKLAESEVYNLRTEREKYLEMEKELNDLKPRCFCSMGISAEDVSDILDTKSELMVKISPVAKHSFDYLHQVVLETPSPHSTGSACESSEKDSDSTVWIPDMTKELCFYTDGYDQHCNQDPNKNQESIPRNLENAEYCDESETLGIQDNCADEEETGSRLSEAVVGSSFQSNIEVSEDIASSAEVDQQNTEIDELNPPLSSKIAEDSTQDINHQNAQEHQQKLSTSSQPKKNDQLIHLQGRSYDVIDSFNAVRELHNHQLVLETTSPHSMGSGCGNCDVAKDLCFYVEDYDQQCNQDTHTKQESFARNLESAEIYDDMKTLGTEGNCSDEEGKGSSLSGDVVVGTFQSKTEGCDDMSSSLEVDQQDIEPDELDQPFSSMKDEGSTQDFNDHNLQEMQQKLTTSTQPISVEKPKRRLLPASSILLRDTNCLDFKDENERPKGNRGEKKLSADERYMTQGNICLVRLLNRNLRL